MTHVRPCWQCGVRTSLGKKMAQIVGWRREGASYEGFIWACPKHATVVDALPNADTARQSVRKIQGPDDDFVLPADAPLRVLDEVGRDPLLERLIAVHGEQGREDLFSGIIGPIDMRVDRNNSNGHAWPRMWME